MPAPISSKHPLARVSPLWLTAGLLFFPALATAHVKWFSDFSFADQPLSLADIVTPTFLALSALSAVAVGALVWLDRYLENKPWFRRLDQRLHQHQHASSTVLRLATGVTLVLCWQADTLLVPEVDNAAAWIGWCQFALALALLFPATVPPAGLGLLALYGYGVMRLGPLHMLDYLYYAGIGYYLTFSRTANARLGGLRLPALYFCVGFSLCWAGLEKFVYPQWGLYVLGQNPQLSLGLGMGFFLVGAAFVEFSLGYLLMIGLLQRPVALIITLVFFSTTLIFGKLEVIGHLLVHAALIVFVLEGPGQRYRAPYTFHKRLGWRTAFAAVNFCLLLLLLVVLYERSAQTLFAQADPTKAHRMTPIELSPNAELNLDLEVIPDNLGGWNLHLQVENFRFAPPTTAPVHVAGEGHAHLHINGRKSTRLYGPWYYLPSLPPGTHELEITLNTNDHRPYTLAGKILSVRQQITVP